MAGYNGYVIGVLLHKEKVLMSLLMYTLENWMQILKLNLYKKRDWFEFNLGIKLLLMREDQNVLIILLQRLTG